ncbi:hypothetical protein BH09PAT2_BH09PAT2_04770 [soil metagenome]
MLKAFIAIIGVLVGIVYSYYYLTPDIISSYTQQAEEIIPDIHQKQVIGFQPYWLLDKADKDYSPYINTFAYFALTVDGEGSIQKYTAPGESEPGWYTLNSGKADTALNKAKNANMNLSLVIFSGNEENIGELISDPEIHARTMVSEIIPVMKKHGFTDLNIDVESVNVASDEARANFSRFVWEVKKQMDAKHAGTFTIDASPTVFVKKYLVDPVTIGPIVDYFVVMGYDYHYPGSSVTGPVAPLKGYGSIAEFDTDVGMRIATQTIASEKLILAIPSYGYEWETIDDFDRAATLPGSGIAASNRRAEELIKDCDTCKIQREPEGQEAYIVYKDEETGMYHQIFYPDRESTQVKVNLAKELKLGGMGIWALGYEGDTMLEPLHGYK